MRNQFNRQVLEQVAKDGKTYASLAKEMARALLESEPIAPEGAMRVFLMNAGDRRIHVSAAEALRKRGVIVIQYGEYEMVEEIGTYMVRQVPLEAVTDE